jgi:hypothetical protein
MLPLSTNSHMSMCPGQFFVEIKIGWTKWILD